MKIRTLIARHIEDNDLLPGSSSLGQWQNQKWVKLRVGNRLLPVFPIEPIRDQLNKHDVHHILTNYHTTWEGEFELAAWEVASGGCHLNMLFWVDRIVNLLLGLVLCPKATLKALRRGWGSRNLYRVDFEEVLEMEVSDLNRLLRLKSVSRVKVDVE